ncbi:ABC transporter permease subunit [Akkermansia sp. N21116]|jgi:iron(III) transport system permease protein|uniref:ABC transporter permease subunit n=1 Tax=Akkermansia sp. N21116 TaxID=3040764 RepID=UPI00244EF125|nr:ABC transporter permease subunit [Akkermansia sp. N21116]WPX40535.1 ABC transporter permease subunit [Akkermansia sp. N21116]
MHHKEKSEIKIVFWAVIAVFAVFLALPMGYLVRQSLSANGSFGLENYAETLANGRFLHSFGNSFLISGASALITTILAFFLAYTVNNTALPGRIRKIIGGLTISPMFLPTITYGFVIIYSFGKEGLLTTILGFQPFDIYGFNGMLLGYVIYTLPIAFLLINNTFKYIDKNFAIVSRIMGDTPIQTFFCTAVRPLVGTLGAAFIQAFTLSFTDFGIPASIGGQFDVVAIHLYNEMLGAIPNFAGGSTIAVIMLLPSIISIILIGYLERYNFRYNKISRQEIKSSPVRDTICASGSLILLGGIIAIFAVMFVVPFVRSWPYEPSLTFDNIIRLLKSPNLTGIYKNSLLVAFFTSAAGTVLAYGASLVTARSELHGAARSIINGIALVTNTIPGMVLGIAYLFAFSGTSLQNTFLILIVCNVIHFFTTPYLMGKSSLEKMNKGWEATASLMGDSWIKTMFRVVIPNSMGTILEIFSYYFINSMITISAIIFLVGARTAVLTTKIKELQHFAKFDEIFVMSILILLTNIVIRVVISRISQNRHAQ